MGDYITPPAFWQKLAMAKDIKQYQPSCDFIETEKKNLSSSLQHICCLVVPILFLNSEIEAFFPSQFFSFTFSFVYVTPKPESLVELEFILKISKTIPLHPHHTC